MGYGIQVTNRGKLSTSLIPSTSVSVDEFQYVGTFLFSLLNLRISFSSTPRTKIQPLIPCGDPLNWGPFVPTRTQSSLFTRSLRRTDLSPPTSSSQDIINREKFNIRRRRITFHRIRIFPLTTNISVCHGSIKVHTDLGRQVCWNRPKLEKDNLDWGTLDRKKREWYRPKEVLTSLLPTTVGIPM